MLHGAALSVPAGGEENAVHDGLTPPAGVDVQALAVGKCEIKMHGRHVIHGHHHIAGTQIPQHALVGHGDHLALPEVPAALQDCQDADGAGVRQLPEPAMLLPAVLAQPRKGAPYNHCAHQGEEIPHGEGEKLIDSGVQNCHHLSVK